MMKMDQSNDGLVFVFIVGIIALLIFGVSWAAHGYPANFDRAFENVLVSEGGYGNDPRDPGGPTKFGITIFDIRHYLKPGATANDVRLLTKDQARTIYREHYATPIGFDYLPSGLDYAVLDYAINAGTTLALRDLQRALGLPTGTMGLSSADAKRIAALKTPDLIRDISARRMKYQMGLAPRFDVFKRGWRDRINSVERISLSMAGVVSKGFTSNMLDFVPRRGPGKAYIPEEVH